MQEGYNKLVSLQRETTEPSLLRRFFQHRFLSVLDGFTEGLLEIVWPDGSHTRHGSGLDAITVTLHSYEPVRSLILSGQTGFAESYLKGQWSTSDIRSLFDLIMRNEHRFANKIDGGLLSRLRSGITHGINRNSLAGSRRNIAYHYDLGNDFYSLWLDPTMSYSAALYKNDEETLEQAQHNKIHRILQLLAPARDSKVLEIGCGWGTLARSIVKRSGASVQAVSLSNAQLDYARQTQADQAQIDQTSVDYQYADYRTLKGEYDHIVSIEMFEAVGMAFWDTYFKQLSSLLKTGGTALLQVITIAESRFSKYRRNPDFIQRYIFPGGMLPTRTMLEKLVVKHGFELKQTDWLGDSYATTLSVWRENFERKLPRIRELGYDERFIRMWRYYLAYCETGFRTQRTNVGMFQIVQRQ